MTGFGSYEKEGFKVEIRSLNHRFVDISMRLSPSLAPHEMELRNQIKERFTRGKFDVSVSLTNSKKASLKLDSGIAREIYDSLNSLKIELAIPGSIDIQTLLSYREFFVSEESEYDVSSLYEAFGEALSQLEKMRNSEGKALAEDVFQRVDRLEIINKRLADMVPGIIEDFRAKFHERLKKLLSGVEYDRDRVFQEIALLIEKSDITEELTRTGNHLKQFKKILVNGDTIGKRLDFLLQELNREVNTIASKAGDYRISEIVVEMKSEIEKIREQIQNIQ